MQDLLREVVAAHPMILQAEAGLRASQSGTDAARMQFWPSPSIQTDSLSGSTATTLRLTQPLWTGGRLTSDLRYNEIREVRSQVEVEVARTNLAIRVASIAQAYVFNRLRRESQERAIVTLNDLGAMIERRTLSQISAASDLNLISTRRSQAQSELLLFRALEETALNQLGQAAGRPLTQQALDIASPLKVKELSRESLLVRALENNPQLRMLDVDIRLAEVDVERTRAGLFPTVALRAEHQSGEYAGSARAGSRIFISLQYAPNAGLSIIPQISAAERRVDVAREAHGAARLDVSDRVDNDWRELSSTFERGPSLAAARLAATNALESNYRLFIAGRRSWIDLLNSARELTQADFAVAEVQSISIGAYYRLAAQIGLRPWTEESILL